MESGAEFLHRFTLPNYQWYKAGVETASPTKSDQVSAFKVLSFPGADIDKVAAIWEAEGEEYRLDRRIKDHIAVEC